MAGLLPYSGAKASAFGSRPNGQRFMSHSDADSHLLIDSPVELPAIALADIRDAMAKSDLALSV